MIHAFCRLIRLLPPRAGSGRDFRRVLMDLELECTINQGKPLFQGQMIDYNRNLAMSLLGQQFSAVVFSGNRLPSSGEYVWENVQVEFGSVPPSLVAWIRPGEQEYAPDQSASWKIERIISNEPAQVINPSSDGTKMHVANHPTHRSVRALVSLRVLKRDGDLYYNGNRLIIGSGISFQARRWSTSASLVSF